MRVLVVGSGGREHAIAHALASSARKPEVLVAPGNAGTATCATNVDADAGDIDSLRKLAIESNVDLTIVGPEKPLVAGLVDAFRADGLPVLGPTAPAARLEGSKAFSKNFMTRHGIPTAAYRTFDTNDLADATEFVRTTGAPIVVKASGLAAGKGAIVCDSVSDAERALADMLVRRSFGTAGEQVVIEEFMEGEEASIFAVCDGTDYVLLSSAQDHKRVGEGDTGPNTGGMGAYAPATLVDDGLLRTIVHDIVEPTLEGMAADGHPYTGFLYVGLMIGTSGPRVVEYNCRLGDPEAQVVLPLLTTDFLEIAQAAAAGNLSSIKPVDFRDGAAATVVLCSGGYPGSYETGHAITGVDVANARPGVTVYHAGTRMMEGRLVTAGGRVLNVTATGSSLADAVECAYAAVGDISFEGMQYRRDIGRKGLYRAATA